LTKAYLCNPLRKNGVSSSQNKLIFKPKASEKF